MAYLQRDIDCPITIKTFDKIMMDTDVLAYLRIVARNLPLIPVTAWEFKVHVGGQSEENLLNMVLWCEKNMEEYAWLRFQFSFGFRFLFSNSSDAIRFKLIYGGI